MAHHVLALGGGLGLLAHLLDRGHAPARLGYLDPVSGQEDMVADPHQAAQPGHDVQPDLQQALHRIGGGAEELDHPFVEGVHVPGTTEVTHQVGHRLRLVGDQEAGDGSPEVLVGRPTGECRPELVDERPQLLDQDAHLFVVVVHETPLL